MRKELLGSTALLCVGLLAMPAAVAKEGNGATVAKGSMVRAEWEINLGGYMEQHIGFASSSVDSSAAEPDFDGVDTNVESEFYFRPSITLDNGIKLSARIEFEGGADDSTNGQFLDVDDAALIIEGSFGAILIGSTNSAGYLASTTTPNGGTLGLDEYGYLGLRDGADLLSSDTIYTEHSAWLFEQTGIAGGTTGTAFRNPVGTTFVETAGHDDANRFTYFTPRFAGFQLGVSYARDGRRDDPRTNCESTTCNYFDIGANYATSLGGFDVTLSGRYGTATSPDFSGSETDDPSVAGFGFHLSQGPIALGGSFASTTGPVGGAELDGTAYEIGASYSQNPWSFGINYFHGKDEADSFEETSNQFAISAAYQLQPGVTLKNEIAYVDLEGKSTFGTGESATTSTGTADGFYIGTGINLSF